MPKKEYSWSSKRVESRFREAREAHLNSRQRFKEEKLAALRGAKSQTIQKNKHKASMSITTLFNSDKNSLLKELIVEDVYEEQDLKQKTGPVEIMKHIYPTRHAPKRSEVPNFAQLPRVLF